MVIVQQVKKFTKPEIKKIVDDFELKVTSSGQPVPIGNQGSEKSATNSLQRTSLVNPLASFRRSQIDTRDQD